ncbi:hypothetical protein HKX61_07930 [Sulfitobacter sp. M77]|nr:hypothetical protein [Sulfitobacter sp. M77]
MKFFRFAGFRKSMESIRAMNNENRHENQRSALIKEQLRRSFQEKAEEELPANLTSLIEQLRQQDEQNGK